MRENEGTVILFKGPEVEQWILPGGEYLCRHASRWERRYPGGYFYSIPEEQVRLLCAKDGISESKMDELRIRYLQDVGEHDGRWEIYTI